MGVFHKRFLLWGVVSFAICVRYLWGGKLFWAKFSEAILGIFLEPEAILCELGHWGKPHKIMAGVS